MFGTDISAAQKLSETISTQLESFVGEYNETSIKRFDVIQITAICDEIERIEKWKPALSSDSGRSREFKEISENAIQMSLLRIFNLLAINERVAESFSQAMTAVLYGDPQIEAKECHANTTRNALVHGHYAYNQNDLEEFVCNANGYISELRSHIENLPQYLREFQEDQSKVFRSLLSTNAGLYKKIWSSERFQNMMLERRESIGAAADALVAQP